MRIQILSGTLSFKIAIICIVSGISSFLTSILYDSAILAFIGLGLVFWGVIFILLRPVKYVEGSLLSSEVVPEYLTIDRIIRDFHCEGQGYYLPSYPKEVRMPEYLKAFKDTVAFVSAEKDFKMPSIGEMAQSKFLLSKSKGILIIPPGIGLLAQAEKQSRLDFSKMEPGPVCDVFSRYTTENFSLARSAEIERSENAVTLKLHDFLYAELYRPETKTASISLLGCPIVSALACALAGATGRIVTIDKHELSQDGMTLDVVYRLLPG